MENAINELISFCISAAGKIVAAVLIYVIGRFIIKKLLALVKKTKGYEKLDPTVRSFTDNFVKALLYVILVICIISVLGVPIASVITVLASAGVAVGLALQGALSNLAGGIMMLVTRPFQVGDYISDGTNAGTVKEINLFYTVLMTPDNCRITIPNGTLMNASVTDYSASGTRRVDLSFVCAFDSDIAFVQNTIMAVLKEEKNVLADPAPFARYEGESTEGMTFTVRVWCKSEAYWDVYYNLKQKIREALIRENIHAVKREVTVREEAYERR